jgi:hypothetical protein
MPGEDGGVNPSNPVTWGRQALDSLAEPTFESLEVYTHDLSAMGTALLITKYPDTKIPLRVLSDSALSVLEEENISMLDLIALTETLDEIKDGEVQKYLDIAWTLLELNNVIRRDDLTAYLTEREQRLVISLFHGVKLGTGSVNEMERLLNSRGPRYTTHAR